MREGAICRRLSIRGRVQGVWYRASAVEEARARGLCGWVKNCRDGSVEAVVCGAPDAVADFIAWADRGPPAARVDRVDVSEADEFEHRDFVARRSD